MIEKIKKIFSNKEKRIENLVSFLIILIITLIVINKILDENNEEVDYQNQVGVELASVGGTESYFQVQEESRTNNDLEKRLEDILSKISGVGKVSVMLTYKESSTFVPIYNVDSSISTIEEKDTSGGTRITETENTKKDVITDSSSNAITEKVVMPSVEGAIIIAKGAKDSNVKTNIISAVEAVTGLATHKIQVFEMGDE